MIYEFVDFFKNIRIGSIISISNINKVPKTFKEHIQKNSNRFIVKEIQEISCNNAMIQVLEVSGAVEYDYIVPYYFLKGIRVFNCKGFFYG